MPPDPFSFSGQQVEIRRSPRRRRTVSARRDGDRVVVSVPARMDAVEEARWVTLMLHRLAARERRSARSDDALRARATQLARQYLPDQVRPASVVWVDNQRQRWGSCTPAEGTIRLSRRLQAFPGWVLDYVLLHELVHLLVPGHGPAFHAHLARYPKAERARGFLEGVGYASSGRSGDDSGEPPDPSDGSCCWASSGDRCGSGPASKPAR